MIMIHNVNKDLKWSYARVIKRRSATNIPKHTARVAMR